MQKFDFIDYCLYSSIAIFFIGLIVVGFAIHNAGVNAEIELKEHTTACEQKGGVFIRHVVGSGKYSKTRTLGCFNKNALIEIE